MGSNSPIGPGLVFEYGDGSGSGFDYAEGYSRGYGRGYGFGYGIASQDGSGYSFDWLPE